MLKKWEFRNVPTEKDSLRWRLKVKISEDEIEQLINSLSGNKGKFFLVEDGVYDFGVYFYNLSEDEYNSIKATLIKICPDGVADNYSRKLETVSDFFSSLAEKLETSPKLNTSPSNVSSTTKIEPAKAESSLPPAIEQPQPTQDRQPKPSASTISVASTTFDLEDIPLNPDYTFENFVVGPNNRFTHAAALAVAKAPGKTYNPFFIYGGVGLGKTHLMQSIGHYIRKNFPELKVLYITTEKFVSDVINAISKGEGVALRNFYKSIDVLLVDDIQSLSQSESTQDEFFHIFNLLHQNKKQIVITCDRPPKLLTVLEDRLRSRFEWGLIADIKSPSLETRVAILKKKEELEGLALDDNILLYIASKLSSNIRELEGFLKKITAYSSLTKQEVDINFVKSLMAELLPSEKEPQLTIAQAQAAKSVPAYTPPPPPPLEKIEIPQIKETDIKIVTKGISETHQIPSTAVPPPPKLDPTLKPVDAVFFYPSTCEKEIAKVKEKFAEVIKKHKLKFQLVSVFDKSYETRGKINYALFTELCKTNKVNIAIVLSPPPDAGINEEEFANVLGAMMADEKISLQLVPWNELNKDYRYLNLALDITLSSTPATTK